MGNGFASLRANTDEMSRSIAHREIAGSANLAARS
jgi:hypothetical protein